MRRWTARFVREDGWWVVEASDGAFAERINSEAWARFIEHACNAAEREADPRMHWHLTAAGNATGTPYAYSCGGPCAAGFATGEEALAHKGTEPIVGEHLYLQGFPST